jgi:hypothetical protein
LLHAEHHPLFEVNVWKNMPVLFPENAKKYMPGFGGVGYKLKTEEKEKKCLPKK